jgi:nitrite reductase/ring-hydroxylating ferredoxin subunit
MPEYLTVARAKDVPPGKAFTVDVEGLRIAVFNINGTYYAIADTCPHAGASLAEGDVDGCTVECPLHSARFDLESGAVLSPPAERTCAGTRCACGG